MIRVTEMGGMSGWSSRQSPAAHRGFVNSCAQSGLRWDGEIPAGVDEQRRDFFLTAPVRIDSSGCLQVPAGPGLGVQIDEDAVSHWALP